MGETLVLFYITVPHTDTGVLIAKTLLEKKLIACGNVLPAHTAVYHWEGAIKEDSEHILILKTRKGLAHKVHDEVKKLHPYDCPCILQITPSDVNAPFVEWMNQQTRGSLE